MSIKNKILDVKNRIIEGRAKKFINEYINNYGEIDTLKIDSINKKIEVKVLLKGEEKSISITLKDYKVIKKDANYFFKFKYVSVSREWIERLIHEVLIPQVAPNNLIKIDSKYAKIIKLLL